MRRHSPLQQLKEAKTIAREHGLFIAEKTVKGRCRYLLYRSRPHGGNVYIGQRGTCEGIRALVCQVTNFN